VQEETSDKQVANNINTCDVIRLLNLALEIEIRF